MLNIGLLAPGAGEYYIGEVATSAEDYYTGRGETAGRWVGSLAEEVGLRGEVSPDDFRAVLAGLDPFTGEQLVHRKASASPKTGEIRSDRSFDVLQAASALGVSGQSGAPASGFAPVSALMPGTTPFDASSSANGVPSSAL